MRLALLILLLFPLTADAAPVVIAAIAYAAGSITMLQFVLIVGMTIYGAAQQRRAERAQRDAYNASLQDRTITSVAADSPCRYVYGRARVGSSIVAIFTSGDKDQFKHLVCVHAAHECDEIEEVYISGKPLGPLDADGYVTTGDYYAARTEYDQGVATGWTFTIPRSPLNNVVDVFVTGADGNLERLSGNLYSFDPATRTVSVDPWGPYTPTFNYGYAYPGGIPRVRVQKHLGSPSDPVDAYLHGLLPGLWPSSAVLRGFCYTVVTLDLNQPEFQGGIQPIEVLLRGKRLYDIRTGTTYWSQNPALVIYDYLTSEMCGIDAADIPVAQLIAAANACGESVMSAEEYGVPGPRYTFNGAVTADQDQKQVLEQMAQSMAGGIVSTTWDIWAGKYVAPVMSLDQSDIVGSVAITPGISDADLYNGVKGQYISPENGYVATDFEPYQNSSYVSVDGVEKWTSIDFPFTANKQRVWNLCRIFTEDQRNGFTVKAEFSLKAWGVKVGQRVTLTSTLFGWAGKVFRVMDKKYSPTSAVELTLKEDAASIWDFVDEALPDATPNTNLPNPFIVAPLRSLTCTSGTKDLLLGRDGTIISRIHVTWPQASTQAVVTNGAIEIEWLKAGTDAWQKLTASGDKTEIYLSPVDDDVYYTVRARCVNPYLNVKSDWVYVTNHKVIGKTEPPGAVTGVSLSQEMAFFVGVPDVDLKGYEVRALPGTKAIWSMAVPLHEGVITDSPYRFGGALQGIQTILVAAIDTSGNYGLPGYATLDFGIVDEYNVAQRYDFQEAGWPGAFTQCSVSGGDVVADLSPGADFWTLGGRSFWVRDNAPDFWGGSAYLPMEYVGIYVPEYSDGDIILDVTTTGARAEIKWRPDGGILGDFWSQGATDFWSGYPSMWGEVAAFQPYIGSIKSGIGRGIQFLVRIDGGPQQGRIVEMTIRLQMPDKEQVFREISISSTGTRLTPSLGSPPVKWIRVEQADFTIFADGSGAMVGRVTDFDPVLGPSVETLNSSGIAVSSTGQTVRIRGF